MAPADAQSYWLSAKIPNDQFLLYCFDSPNSVDGQDDRIDEIASDLRRAARRVPDLRLRVREVPGHLDRPYWVSAAVAPDQVRVHRVDGAGRPLTTWDAVLDRLGELISDQLIPDRAAWRVHLFGPIAGAPGVGAAPAVVCVVQVCHALGDGRRTSGIARELFVAAADPAIDDVDTGAQLPGFVADAFTAALGLARVPIRLTMATVLGARAFRAARRHPPQPGAGTPVTAVNQPPGDRRLLRTLVLPKDDFGRAGPTLTSRVVTAIAVALGAELDDPAAVASVELTIGRPPETHSRNNFGNVGIDTHPQITDLAERVAAVGTEIGRARHHHEQPARRAARRASEAAPAGLTRWGISLFDPTVRPTRMTGTTVVSSVDRGPADLTLGGGVVRCTAGFPALSPSQGITHGVHGIGDTITVSITTSPAIMPDPDAYVARLRAAVADVAAAGQVRGG